VRDGKDIILIKAEKEVLLRDVAHIANIATASRERNSCWLSSREDRNSHGGPKRMAVEDLVDMTAMVDIVSSCSFSSW